MMSCKLWLKYKDCLVYDESEDGDGEELGLSDDAPPEAKEAYEINRMIHGNWTSEERKAIKEYFKIIQPYIIGTSSRHIRDDAPYEVINAYEKLKEMHVVLSNSGARIRP